MKSKMLYAWLFIKGFIKGMGIGFDSIYYTTFNQKLPRAICWLIGILLIPLNLIVILLMLVCGQWRALYAAGNDMVQEVKKIREAKK
jgi:hypothetical protein